jgi:signal transduction histidine kinase
VERDLESHVETLGGSEGLGIGMLLARNIVERHGGHFGVMSEFGRGTEVFLSFPSRPSAYHAGDQAPSVNPVPEVTR